MLSVTDAENAYAQEVGQKLEAVGIRVEVDLKSDKINLKVSEAERQKIPFMLVVGGREAAQGAVSVRRRGKGNVGAATLEAVLAQIKEENNVPG